MPFMCCVPYCNGKLQKRPKSECFSFPRDEVLAGQWLRSIKRTTLHPRPIARLRLFKFHSLPAGEPLRDGAEHLEIQVPKDMELLQWCEKTATTKLDEDDRRSRACLLSCKCDDISGSTRVANSRRYWLNTYGPHRMCHQSINRVTDVLYRTSLREIWMPRKEAAVDSTFMKLQQGILWGSSKVVAPEKSVVGITREEEPSTCDVTEAVAVVCNP
ncbi:hypothetical protein GWK47_050621 [Chionoecetes opilio]|uniref:THAP-type domain-containing protein n=1 Tax=Chionoecetes opilio TaxID=41210 RepID=A0A8J4Y1F0_CHIOP|nr:hypothetical protein GWK47_050621 [Chionoecetes opilio]